MSGDQRNFYEPDDEPDDHARRAQPGSSPTIMHAALSRARAALDASTVGRRKGT